MGTVYAAWDPELDRAVAVKLVSSRHAQATARMQREAQAMAAVVHPNVVVVYEVGMHDGGVYIAMELVDGPTLREWLRSDAHTWREVLAMFVQAGHGLAAAHRSGLVHRDFKPTNVLVAADGRARVLDFGLARAGPTWDSADRERVEADAFDEALTVPGTVMGTPAYMAPEQFAGRTVTAASDQFSFCVALWEALVGKRPFEGETFRELSEAVTRDRRRSVPTPPPVPAGLLRVIDRGLAHDPAERWPAMDDLLDRLHAWVRPRRLWPWAAAAIVAAAGVATWASLPDEASCADDPGPWAPAQRVAVEQAVLAAAGEDVWAPTLDRLDAFASAWSDARRELCEGGIEAVGGQRPFDQRRACLERARAQLDAVLDLLARSEGEVAARAPELVAGLPAIEDCRQYDAASLAEAVPDDPDAAQEVSRIREQLARVQAHVDAGAFADGLALADATLADAASVEFAPVVAEALLRRGVLQSRLSEPDAEATLTDAFWTAADLGHDDVAMEASLELAWLVGYVQSRVEEGLAWARHAEAAMRRIGRDPARNLSAVLGPIYYAAGRWDEARVHLERELAINEERYGAAAHQTAMSRMNLANLDLLRGDRETACKEFVRAASDLEAEFPEGHAALGLALANAGSCEMSGDDHAEAERLYVRALAVYEAVLGPDHPDTADAREALGNLHSVEGRHDLALPMLRRAAAALEHAPTEARASANITLASAMVRAGDVADAEQRLRDALAEVEAAFGAEHELAGFAHHALGGIHADRGELAEARRHYERAHEIDVLRHGADHPTTRESARILDEIVARQREP